MTDKTHQPEPSSQPRTKTAQATEVGTSRPPHVALAPPPPGAPSAAILNPHAILQLQRVIGNRAVGQLLQTARRSPVTPAKPMQRTAADAASYSKDEGLGLPVHDKVEYKSRKRVKTKVVSWQDVVDYVNDSNNHSTHRRRLLHAWNKGQSHFHVIQEPNDLKPSDSASKSSGVDMTGYDSNEDDAIDLVKAKVSLSSEEITIYRPTSETAIPNVKVYSLHDGTRLARQVIKQNKLDKSFIMAVKVGDFYIELSSPRGNDVTGSVLHLNKDGTYQRATNITNWSTISGHLDSDKNSKFEDKLDRIIGAFSGSKVPLSAYEADAIGAIASDYVKGYFGASEHLKKIKQAEPESFRQIFSGDNPIYGPAAFGGRKLVRMSNKDKPQKVPDQAPSAMLMNNNNNVNVQSNDMSVDNEEEDEKHNNQGVSNPPFFIRSSSTSLTKDSNDEFDIEMLDKNNMLSSLEEEEQQDDTMNVDVDMGEEIADTVVNSINNQTTQDDDNDPSYKQPIEID